MARPKKIHVYIEEVARLESSPHCYSQVRVAQELNIDRATLRKGLEPYNRIVMVSYERIDKDNET